MTAIEWPPKYDPEYLPLADQPYWFADVETMDPEDRERRIILPKLKAQLCYCYERSPFYRERFDAVGFDPKRMQTLSDLRYAPLTLKSDLRAEQMAHPPFGRHLCIEPVTVTRIHGTSGTTGRPTMFGIGRDDWSRIANAHARIMWSFGVRPSDVVFIGSFFSTYLGSWGCLVGAERLHATAFPYGAGVPGQTERSFEWLRSIRPTVFYGTPSYALHLGEKAKDAGFDPRDFGFRVLFFSGEPGAGIPTTKRRIEETYSGICIDCGSTSEMTPWMTNCETSDRHGMLVWNDIVYTEVVDSETGEAVPYGGEGILVYTHLERTSQPMVRFQSGDISRWVLEPNPCGRTYPRLPEGIYGRSDDMITVRGENVYVSAIEDVVTAIPEYGGEYRIVVSRDGEMDELVVRIEVTERSEELVRRLEKSMQARLGLRTNVELLSPGVLDRTEFKARRLIDDRDLYRRIVSS